MSSTGAIGTRAVATGDANAPAAVDHRGDLAQGSVLGTGLATATRYWVLDNGRIGVATAQTWQREGYTFGNLGRAVRAGKSGLVQPELRLLRTAGADLLRGPTAGLVPLTGWWGRVNQLSNWTATGLALAVVGSAVVNLQDGLRRDGLAGIPGTDSGRTGAFQLSAILFGLSYNVRAAVSHRNPGQGALEAFNGAKWLAERGTRNVRYVAFAALGLATLANELGAFNFLNTTRPGQLPGSSGQQRAV